MVGGNKVVATLAADGKVYPEGFMVSNTLMNYKIRTEADMANKSLNTLSVATTVVDLGKRLLQYARDSDLKGVRNMMSRGAPFTSDWLGMSALHFAAMNNQYEICEALLKGGINKDSKTKVDRTPLHLACYYGHENIVQLLLSKNCAINPRDMLGMTPLHWSVEKGHKPVVRLLLEQNADVTVSSKFGRTPIALAVMTEQADLLAELELAKQVQVHRKISDEQEDAAMNKKETSDAVNSIMGVQADTLEEGERLDGSSNDHDFEGSGEQAAITNFDNIKETGVFDHTAINLLKSHGISLMHDDDNDTSKDLLTTVLRNGRQLVLTEGGKLLLNEANRTQNELIINGGAASNNGSSCSNISSVANSYNNNSPSSKNHNNNSSNVGSTGISAIRNQVTPINKIRTNIIAKSKDTPGSLGKNKNIRIISLNDFKKLYGSTSLKAIHKLPSSLANSRVVRKLTEEAHGNSAERTIVVNRGQMQNRQVKLPFSDPTKIGHHINGKENPAMDIIELEPTDSEAELNDAEHFLKGSTIKTHSLRVMPNRQPAISTQTVRQFLPATSKLTQGGIVSRVTATSTSSESSLASAQLHGTAAGSAVRPTTTTTANATSTGTSSPAVIPLLGMPEVCRQLWDLRRQNEDLRRKFDAAQKEKEEMRQRLERLEELLLVERMDDDYHES